MKINELYDIKEKTKLFERDSNGREINIYKLSNVMITGESLFYPNTLLFSNGELFNPINENTMSLKGVENTKSFNVIDTSIMDEYTDKLFFFVYNTDNYFHFVYDSLPYLITFKKLKEEYPDIKLLMNYPNPNKKEHYRFIIEFFKILNIPENDIIIVNNKTLYNDIYISTSYTHDFDSNLPPRNEIYGLYNQITNKVKETNIFTETDKKIYISRRSWLHGDNTNIGTNYTTRRKMVNEDKLVELLLNNGYKEVFTETMTTEDKILLFSSAEKVIGAIGGGLCNVLFSNTNCELTAIVSPGFLDVNERFKFSFNNVKTELFDDTKSIEIGEFKTNMRIMVGDIVGEITEISGNEITISYSDTKISGWNNDIEYKIKKVNSSECVKLDNGLNSPWEINLEEFKQYV